MNHFFHYVLDTKIEQPRLNQIAHKIVDLAKVHFK